MCPLWSKISGLKKKGKLVDGTELMVLFVRLAGPLEPIGITHDPLEPIRNTHGLKVSAQRDLV